MNINSINRISTYTSFMLVLALMVLNACTSVSSADITDLSEKDKTLLKDKSKKYKTLRVGQFQVHYQKDSYSASQKETFEQEIEYALSQSLKTVNVNSYDKEAHFILFPTKEDMDAHLGQLPIRHYVNPEYNTGYFVHNEDLRPYFTQNLFQMIAIENWGRPKGIMLAIGGSLFADARCGDVKYFLDEVGAAYARAGNVMSYRAMFKDFYPALKARPILAEIQAATLYQFVQDNFGTDKIRELWTYGLSRIEGVIYLSPGEVERDLIGRWRNYTPTQEVDLENIDNFGC